MPARAISSATVSFGLVSIPIKVYSAHETSNEVRFNMVHAEDGVRVKQQYVCPKDEKVVSREEMARGYEFAKGQYVILSDDEYKALLEVADNTISLSEFVPSAKVDPIYFERSYYLGPDKGGERAYKLLNQAMRETKLVGLARYAARGKQYLVLVRPLGEDGLVMHQLHYADEIKAFSEVPIKESKPATSAEIKLAIQLIEQIASKTFDPTKYSDEVKGRMLELIEKKVEGEEITAQPEQAPQAQVIDLMDALRQSLGMGGGKAADGDGEGEGEARRGTRRSGGGKAPSKGKAGDKAAGEKRRASRRS
jgi:DNA end-binding protein Ku